MRPKEILFRLTVTTEGGVYYEGKSITTAGLAANLHDIADAILDGLIPFPDDELEQPR